MATSGTITFGVNRDQLITLAMKLIGKLGEAETPTAEETSDCALLLNMMVKQWIAGADFAPGLKMWKRTRADLFLSASSGSYSLGPAGRWAYSAGNYQRTLSALAAQGATAITVSSIANAANGDSIGIQLLDGSLQWTTISGTPSGSTINLAAALTAAAASGNYAFNYASAQQATRPTLIETAVLRNAMGEDSPLQFLTLQEYEALPSKGQTTYKGDPIAIYYEPQLTNGVLYTDVGAASDVTKRIRCVYQEPIEDFSAATDDPEFPQEWYLALAWGLAKQAAPMFNVPFTQDMRDNFDAALGMAREANAETTALYFLSGSE